jgi:hypothetical protein
LPPSTGGGSTPTPPSADDVRPLSPEVTPVPPATTPVPAGAAEPSGPEVTPAPVYANADDDVPVALVVLAALIGAVALAALILALLSRAGWGDRALAGPKRAWREAAFRAGGTWGDFADWIRVGR